MERSYIHKWLTSLLQSIWEWLKSAADAVWQWLTPLGETLWQWARQFGQAAWQFGSELWPRLASWDWGAVPQWLIALAALAAGGIAIGSIRSRRRNVRMRAEQSATLASWIERVGHLEAEVADLRRRLGPPKPSPDTSASNP
jgi:hypothetical protein